MASLLEGMFSTPQDIRNKRMDELLAERQAIGRMGGSFDQLLGQVAAGGSATGAMLAEGTAGMFGLQTPEEAKAIKVQGLMKGLQGNTDPQAYYSAAKQLNDMGYIRESIALIEQGKAAAQEQRAINQDTRSAEAAKRAEELFPIQRRGAELTNQNTQLNIEDATLARDRKAKVDAVVSQSPTSLLATDPISYYTTLGQQYAEQGLGAEAQSAYKTVLELRKAKQKGTEGYFTAVNEETGEFVRLANSDDGTLVQLTGQGAVPVDFKFRQPVSLTGNPASDKLSLTKEARAQFGPLETAVRASELAVEFGEQALANPSEASKLEPQLDRALATLVGDKQLGLAEVQYIVGQAGITTKVADTVSKLMTGTSTTLTLEQKKRVAEVARDFYQARLKRSIQSFDENFGQYDIDIEQYKTTANGGVSSNAGQYIK